MKCLLFATVVVSWVVLCKGQVQKDFGQPSCEKTSCYTATGNLLIGRENRLWASSTCGRPRSRFCIVSHVQENKKCFSCDADYPALSHNITNIVRVAKGRPKWWQSENGVENVTIRLDLEAEFHFTHLIINFKTFQPAAMLIERSSDFGKTWQVYRYFAYDCATSFPGIPAMTPTKVSDVVCESRYSKSVKSTGGEVILRILNPNVHRLYNDSQYSPEIQNLLKMTNLRINFTKLHTLGDDLLDSRTEIKEKYYYAITQMVVRGSCSCYGHASQCLPLPDQKTLEADMVYGQCQCNHNTKGLNCESCKDFYNDLPWKPAIKSQPNACKRCNCNNHATKCHFDESVYEMTGRISGGVCDDCEHNTVGRNCEKCKPYYYRDPDRDYADPEVCLKCDCHPDGTTDDGICDSETNEAEGKVAGNCHCKTNVGGRRCDECKNGFWNFDRKNELGCEPCSCNINGTIDQQGCNKDTGDCTCKVYVTGRDCNQCLPRFWGLSESDSSGCKPCECDPGGAYDDNCDVISGQCKCRSHVSGRTCSIPESSFFSVSPDMPYEAEISDCRSSNCLVEIREPPRDGSESTWSGTGFMRTFEKTELVFEIDNVKTSMPYDIIVRYEPETIGDWENVEIQVERPQLPDPEGPCGNINPSDDLKYARLPAGARAVKVSPPVCLDAGQKYKVYLRFREFRNGTDTPTASILIDSIALTPSFENIPFFKGPENADNLREFEHYRCEEAYISVYRGSPIPEACKKYHFSIGVLVHGGAAECDCDPTGSVSGFCDEVGGQCKCKPNVEGRRCDRCAPGTYGFGPEGCKSCDCNSYGALDNFCDVGTGQCKCRAQTYGRECDQCSPGSWNYPNCQRCICNGHADLCDSKNGTCLNCRDYTVGTTCDRCVEGYYGDPRLGTDIPCRPCPCPDTIESGHSYADVCQLDPRTQDVICACKEGYGGTRCNQCLNNYFGNPTVLGGSCSPCMCSNNTDLVNPGNCDAQTGKCLQCLHSTEGDHCEVCKAGYYGNALEQNCNLCFCDFLGTDRLKGPCDRVTGQCPCLPNVIGVSCNECAKNHWKLASGIGCEACDCDPIGSTSEECNIFNGQCNCKQGFGGRRCDECQSNFWGNPNVECYPCECNLEGSASTQCHQNNGSCFCREGIGGSKCDVCARGYIGTAPYCTPCGECFNNWDHILNQLSEQTNRTILEASNIKATGASGAYTKEFEILETKIEEVKSVLENTTRSSYDLNRLIKIIEDMKNNVSSDSDPNNVSKLLGNTNQRINRASFMLKDLKNRADLLKARGDNLKENATLLQENNIEGALILTREAHNKSVQVKMQSSKTEKQIEDVNDKCKRTEKLLELNAAKFEREVQDNERALQKLTNKIDDLENNLPDLNDLICDKRGDPCDFRFST